MPESIRLHLFADNEDLPVADYEKAAALIATTRDLHLQARTYIEREGLDADVFLPGNVWATLIDADGFFDWTWDFVNYVKTLAPFSGFHSMMWGRLDVPPDSELALDAKRTADLYQQVYVGTRATCDVAGGPRTASSISRTACGAVRQHSSASTEALLDGVPEKYRIRLPKRGGEIGILHSGCIVNYDLVVFQSRMNALYGAGRSSVWKMSLRRGATRRTRKLDRAPRSSPTRCATVSTGASTCSSSICRLSWPTGARICPAPPDPTRLRVVTTRTFTPVSRPFVYVANYLVPACERNFPFFDLVHNANSLNEMNERQVEYYMAFVRAHLAPTGCFHLSGTYKIFDYHHDVVTAAARAFPRHRLCLEPRIGAAPVMDPQHLFCYSSTNETP